MVWEMEPIPGPHRGYEEPFENKASFSTSPGNIFPQDPPHFLPRRTSSPKLPLTLFFI
ncbi:hypothetical protein NITGR_140005 [Nitrospina gracilis 3/211]|uniref:Uncharacterized protein n=1 Tax=Nitrospina gracilis (strain 3/211) TaxID=1266370 RepID=M1YGN0_NITG3|nr:hypothetical protein NITGR_140005 [Nitrospina gracilis 3/211]